LIAVLLGALFLLPRPWFAGLVGLVSFLAALEWARLCRLGAVLGYAYAALAPALFAVLYLHEPWQPPLWIAAAFWIVLAPLWLLLGMGARHAVWLAIAGLLIVPTTALAMLALAPLQLLLVLVLVWIADIAAYFVGRAWGRRKLAPSISPGKTWEGAAGGVVGAVLYAIICGTFIEGISWPPYLAAAVLLAILSIVGDLFESAAKRQAEVKDSGVLLPGHGGILDRIDSATATLPVAVLVLPFVQVLH
jgi:phosphatidate cytidylyltransferase